LLRLLLLRQCEVPAGSDRGRGLLRVAGGGAT
jgi:hypothetical protein